MASAQLSLGIAAPRPALTAGPGAPTDRLPRVLPLPARLVRQTLRAAYDAAGAGGSDAGIDGASTRSRLAALLPEVRLRGAQYAGLDSILYDASSGRTTGSNRDQFRDTRTLEARVTWRLDRLVYGGDEPQLERLRTDRLELRLKLASKVLEALLARHRARVELGRWPGETAEADEAALHLAEAEATLDALTAGGFTRGFSCTQPCE